MKKHFLFVMVVIFMASCSEQHFLDDYVSQTTAQLSEQEPSQTGIVDSYLEKARWGDGDAFLNLAKCYHDGIGVKSDFMGTLTMLMMADQYGVPNHSVEDYLMSLPDTDHTKMIFEAIAKLDRRNILPTDSIVENLIANGSADGYALRGVVQVERGDTLGGQQSIKKGAEMGSSFAELLLCAFPAEETGYGKYVNTGDDPVKHFLRLCFSMSNKWNRIEETSENRKHVEQICAILSGNRKDNNRK